MTREISTLNPRGYFESVKVTLKPIDVIAENKRIYSRLYPLWESILNMDEHSNEYIDELKEIEEKLSAMLTKIQVSSQKQFKKIKR